jgi:ankyrin repeat protein
LLQAATVSDGARLETALQNGANPNVRAARDWTPLMLAARSGDVSGVAELLKHGAKVNATNDLGQTALMVCHRNVVKSLVDAGAAVDARASDGIISGLTALMMTSDVEKARALLAVGADVNARATFGDTPLMVAALRGETDRVKILIEAGADVNADTGGSTALMRAAYQGGSETVRLLLNAGADVRARDLLGRTALHFAAENMRRAVLDAILAARPDVNSQANDGRTPLLLAVQDGYVDNVRALLAAGADPSIGRVGGQNALGWAIAQNHQEIAGLLRDAGMHESGNGTPALDELKRAARNEGLLVFATDVMTDGRVAKIRGRVKNTYGERVQGVYYVVTLIASGATRPLETRQYETSTSIDPGQDAPLRLDIESMYLGSEPTIVVGAFPAKLGNQDLSPPTTGRP